VSSHRAARAAAQAAQVDCPSAVQRALRVLGVADGPCESLDQLLSGMVVTEMQRVDALVEQHRRVALVGRRVALIGGVCRDDDSGHNSLLGIGVMSSLGHCCTSYLNVGLILVTGGPLAPLVDGGVSAHTVLAGRAQPLRSAGLAFILECVIESYRVGHPGHTGVIHREKDVSSDEQVRCRIELRACAAPQQVRRP